MDTKDPRAKAVEQLNRTDKERSEAEAQRQANLGVATAVREGLEPGQAQQLRAALEDLLGVSALEQITTARVGQWQAAARQVLRLVPGLPGLQQSPEPAQAAPSSEAEPEPPATPES